MLTLIRDADVEEKRPYGGFEENDAILLEEDHSFLVAGMPRQVSPETIEMEPERKDYASAMRGAGVRPDLFSAVRGAEEGEQGTSSAVAAATTEETAASSSAAAAEVLEPLAPPPRRGVKRTRFGKGVEMMKKLSRAEVQGFVLPYITEKLEDGTLPEGPMPPAARWAAKGYGPRPWDPEVTVGGASASAAHGAGSKAAIDGLNLDLNP